MKPLERIRGGVFWALDRLKGSPKRTHYKEIERCFSKGCTEDDKIDNLLEYATTHVPFYADYKGKNISEFPVMTKELYRAERLEQFISDEYVGNGSLHTVFTSGSTGTPFKVVQDANKRNRTVADLTYAHDHIGWHLGDKYIFIRNWVSNYKQSRVKSIAQNVHNVNITGFNDEEKRKLCDYLKKHHNAIIFGYASAVYEFACFVDRSSFHGADFAIKLIVCDSDELTPKMRRFIEKVFSAFVYNRYDNEECGLLAISKKKDDRLYVNYPSIYFELLKISSNDPVKPGEMGRVVVTDLYNHAMPLIRYDLGDLAVSNDESGKIKCIEYLAGRKHGSLTNTENRLVSSVAISGALEPFIGIQKYQVIQFEGYRYILKYIGFIDEQEADDLMKRMRTCFGDSANITLENTDKLEAAKTGKFQTTKNMCN